MTMLRQHEQAEPCFITDGPPFNDMPIPLHRTMNLPQILSGLTDDELARWPGDFADAEREKRGRAGVERHPTVLAQLLLALHERWMSSALVLG